MLYVFLNEIFDFKTSKGGKILGIVFIPFAIYFAYKYKKYNKIYMDNYKDKVIKNFVTYIDNSLNYHQHGDKQLLNHYLDANFEDKNFNTFGADDYIEGYNPNCTKIELCNISLENTNEKGELLNLVYEGIFSITKLNISLPEELRITKNNYFFNPKHSKIEMDSNEFEKYFDVYSNSNILAMEILTHEIMEELVQFYSTYKIKFELVLKDNNIYIRFDTGVMFEPNILTKSNNINTLWVYYNILTFVINITIKINKLLKDLNI